MKPTKIQEITSKGNMYRRYRYTYKDGTIEYEIITNDWFNFIYKDQYGNYLFNEEYLYYSLSEAKKLFTKRILTK